MVAVYLFAHTDMGMGASYCLAYEPPMKVQQLLVG